MAKFQIYKLSDLNERLRKIASANRYDQVSRNIHGVFGKRAEMNPGATVTSEDIKQTFSTFASMNTKSNFRDYFPEVFLTASEVVNENRTVNESMFSRDNTPAEAHREMALEPVIDKEDQIKGASLERLKEIVEASIDFPEYKYGGFTKIQKYGNSGFANWVVSFNTGHGVASVGVPVVVVDGYPNTPDKFVTASGDIKDFNKQEILSYSKAYVSKEARAEQSSGLQQLGSQTTIAQQILEAPAEATESHNVSLNYSVPMDAQFSAKFDSSQQALMQAIELARAEALSKLDGNGEGVLNLSVQINYSGALDLCEHEGEIVNTPEHPMGEMVDPQMGHEMFGEPVIEGIEVYPIEDHPTEDYNGVITFNATNRVPGGVRVATLMVRVANGEAEAQAFYGDGEVHKLSGDNLNNFLQKEITTEAGGDEDGGVEAFSDAFLVNASLNELRKEMKFSIDSGNTNRANACMKVIAARVDGGALSSVMGEYLEWTKEASTSHGNSNKCEGCAFLEKPGIKSAYLKPYCNKFLSPVAQVKIGSVQAKDCSRRTSAPEWDQINDSKYDGVMKTSSIYFS